MEFGEIYSQSTRPESQIIERYVGPDDIWSLPYTKEYGQEFIRDLQSIGIQHIIVFHELEREKNNTYLQQLELDKLIYKQQDNKSLTVRTITSS